MSRARSTFQAAPDAAQRRVTAARNRRALRRKRAALDARWRHLSPHFNPDSPRLPPMGKTVLLLGWCEVFDEWPSWAAYPRYRRVEVIRRGCWTTYESFWLLDEDKGDDDPGMHVAAWQFWVELTQIAKEVVDGSERCSARP
jgi:hypothetical protein